jgi:hypothetical protein
MFINTMQTRMVQMCATSDCEIARQYIPYHNIVDTKTVTILD